MAAPIHKANSAAGRKGKAASPWSKGPHAATPKAQSSFLTYCKRGKAQAK